MSLLTRFSSSGLSIAGFRKFFFRFVLFFVRICRKPCFLYFTFPEPVTEKRLDALFLVFIFGIQYSFFLFF